MPDRIDVCAASPEVAGSALRAYGWNCGLEEKFRGLLGDKLVPGRVIGERKGAYRVVSETGEMWATLSGNLLYRRKDRGSLPTVGDWVALEYPAGTARIVELMPRKTCFRRKSPGPGAATVQDLAANIDTAFLMMSLNRNFNLRRLERFLAAAWSSGAQPLVLLSKVDICHGSEELTGLAQSVSPGVPCLAISSVTGQGLEEVRRYLNPGATVALLGPSGVGKSTLLNSLYGRELLETEDIRPEDDRGRHTTTSRDLVLLPGGALLLDTPGLRELALWDAEEGVSRAFADVEQLAAGCRYRNCSHQHEPGCAVKTALGRGQIESDRLANYQKLQRELAYSIRRQDPRREREEKRKWRKIRRLQREIYTDGRKRGWRK